MAQEEIKLVGSFKDDITPKLKKITREMDGLARSFAKFTQKLRPVSREFGKMAVSAKSFSDAMQSQRRAMTNSAQAMSEYRRQASKTAGAMRRIGEEQERMRRSSGMSRAQARRGAATAGPGGAPAGGGAQYGAQAAKGFNAGIGSVAIGTAIGTMASQAMMRGLQGLKNLALAPFKKFGAAFTERIGDEMDDIKSAGGLFALDMDLTAQSGNERFFKNYNEALRYQETLNIQMAESAASLPGVTSQYVSTSRQLTDTIQMVMDKDRESFRDMAAEYGANVGIGGVEGDKNAFSKILQKQTEQVMLMSQGQTGGLPMHIAIQQLLAKESKGGKLGIQAFTNKFRAAFQKNPMLKNMLMRAEEEMAKTEANSADRLKAIMEVFDKALPKEQINKMRGSLSGMQEALRSGLFDPQAGLFGMSRAVKEFDAQGNVLGNLMKTNVDDFGNVLYKLTDDIFDVEIAEKLGLAGEASLKGAEVTAEQLQKLGLTLNAEGKLIDAAGKEFGGVSKSTTYIFEVIREILAGFGPVLLEFVGFLPSLFDPFADMTKGLMPLRDKSQQFISVFNKNLDSIEDFADNLAKSTNQQDRVKGIYIKEQSRSRAAIATMSKFLESIGALDKATSTDIVDDAMNLSGAGETYSPIENVKKIIGATLNSDLMGMVGEMMGQIIGGITKAVVDLISGARGLAKGDMGNKLTEGFKIGLEKAFGNMSMKDVKGVFTGVITDILMKGLDLVFTQVLPTLLDMYIAGLFQSLISGNPLSMLLGALGIVKLVGALVMVVNGVMAAATFLGGMMTTLGGIVTFVSANLSVLSGIIGTVLVAVVAPILAVAGAVMIVIAVVRNFGSIIQMAGGVLKVFVGNILQVGSKFIGAFGMMIQGIGNMMGPLGGGLRKMGEDLRGAGSGLNEFGDKLNKEGTQAIKDAASGMAQQFQEDSAAIRKKLGFSGAGDAEGRSFVTSTNAQAEFVAATNQATSAQRESAEALSAITDAERTAINTTAGMDMQRYTDRKAEIAAQLAELRGEGPLPTGGTAATAAPAAVAAAAPVVPPETTAAMNSLTEATTAAAAPVNQMATSATSVAPSLEQMAPAVDSAVTATENLGSATDGATSSVETFASSMDGIPAQVEAVLVGAATTAGGAITTAAQGLASALSSAAQSIKSAASASGSSGGDKAESKFDGKGGKMMPLGQAIETERKNMPSGSNLVIANSSETVIPAYKGHMGEGFKGLSFAELESAAGFDRMASYTDQISEIADKTAASFSGGFGGALGGGSATLNAMEALGHSFGLMTTSGFRPGDPGYHGANRARDLSNGGGETPEMNAAASKMASEFGSSLTELIYTPMGFSIKNGQKTGLISPSNHYHHIHVAVAEGLAKAAVFSSEKAAMQYERSMMPAGASPMKVDLSSMTANSSEFAGGGNIDIGGVNVSVSGVDDPKAIANQVAEEILLAIEKTTYREVYTS